ncbi:Sulfhydryl oxidase [Fasciola gigantica]|uniref:Sulfhydryl oxidase n=1 Tax=Fasciola gigantica TaxID=46835 RepID=A0A504YPV7_FASGI|nr:Sulfhydryl oxidase [Fasciola gigantica]
MGHLVFGERGSVYTILTIIVLLYQFLSASEVPKVNYRNLQLVTWLTNETFESHVSSGRWLVIFYRSSCGGCKMYYPYFKGVVNKVAGWPKSANDEPLLKLGSVDCETAVGKPVCLRYNASGVPALRYFPGDPNFRAQSYLGVTIKASKNSTLVVRNVVQEILRETEMVPRSEKLYSDAVMVESNSHLENTLIILEFQKHVSKEMKSYVNPKATMLLVRMPNGGVIYSGSPESVRRHLLINEENVGASYSNTTEVDRETYYKHETPVYAVDLFRGLSAIFESDMVMFTRITGEERLAVLEFISLLEKILPASKTYRQNLTAIHKWVSEREVFSGVEWMKALKDQKFPLLEGEYRGCQGSEITYRGYPCALWTLFHALTVSQCEREAEYPDLKPTAVLHAMNRFLPRFFSCLECAYHFALNSRQLTLPNETAIPTNRDWPNEPEFTHYKALSSLPDLPETCDDQILWLNEAHNGVNLRLQHQPTEDPLAPKVVYPPRSLCQSCWDEVDGQWRLGATEESKEALVQFLKRHFSSANWVLDDVCPSFITNAE